MDIDAQSAGVIGGLVLTAIGMLAGWTWRQHRRAIAEAEQRALATARSEALVREAQAALDAKNDELDALRAVSTSELDRVRGHLATCEQARTELRRLLLQCTSDRNAGA